MGHPDKSNPFVSALVIAAADFGITSWTLGFTDAAGATHAIGSGDLREKAGEPEPEAEPDPKVKKVK